MLLRSLKLTNFRNYDDFKIDFTPLTIFIGPNGIGKTNLIEAVYMLSIGKSYRTKNDQEIICWQKDYSKIFGEIENNNLEIFISQSPIYQKIIKINSVKKKIVDFLGKLKVVLFSPESMQIITGSPKERRRFLDLILGQINKKYFQNLLELQMVLKNRNHLLYNIKIGKSKPDELDFWDQKLVELGTYIVEERNKLINFLNTKINNYYQIVSGKKEEIKIKYIPSITDLNYYLDFLFKNKEKEINYGLSLFGPHRDELTFIINKRNVNCFASRGEIRSIIFALKMSEIEFLKKQKIEPVFLLDDIFSELDLQRRKKLMEIIKDQQTIITSTNVDFLDSKTIQKAKIVDLDKINVV